MNYTCMNKMHFSRKPSSEIGENPMTAAASMASILNRRKRGGFPAMSTDQTRLLRLTNGRWRERALTIFGAFSLF
jgi:hypothetical protein